MPSVCGRATWTMQKSITLTVDVDQESSNTVSSFYDFHLSEYEEYQVSDLMLEAYRYEEEKEKAIPLTPSSNGYENARSNYQPYRPASTSKSRRKRIIDDDRPRVEPVEEKREVWPVRLFKYMRDGFRIKDVLRGGGYFILLWAFWTALVCGIGVYTTGPNFLGSVALVKKKVE